MPFDQNGRPILNLCEWLDELWEYGAWAEENKAPCGWAACHDCKYYWCEHGEYGEGDTPHCTEPHVCEYFIALSTNTHEKHRLLISGGWNYLLLWFCQDDGEVMFPVECVWRKDKREGDSQ